jgi:hypothetical protein
MPFIIVDSTSVNVSTRLLIDDGIHMKEFGQHHATIVHSSVLIGNGDNKKG